MPADYDIKGWCPGALRPMASGDGLVVRVRLPFGRMTPHQALGIAQAARLRGNGQLELSGRANLQLRGVTEASHRPLLSDLAALGVLDSDLTLESRRNILLSPFWTADDGTTLLAAALKSRLMDLPDLPGKFGHVIDIGPNRVLAEASGDLRLERGVSGGLILRADGAALGQPVTPKTAIPALIALAHWFVDHGGITQGRGRMRALIQRALIQPTLTQRGPTPPKATEAPVAAAAAPPPGTTPHGILAAFEFGSITADTLTALAGLGHSLRLTPWRMVLFENLTDPAALHLIPGVITDPDNPLLAVRACPGAPFCPQGLGATRDLARSLARSLLARVPKGQILHISGCAKGCAHPLAADLTLVAGLGGFAAGHACAASEVSGPARPVQQLLTDPNIFDQSGAA